MVLWCGEMEGRKDMLLVNPIAPCVCVCCVIPVCLLPHLLPDNLVTVDR